MKSLTSPLKLQRQRKFFLVLPLFVVPLVTAIFWGLGGGNVNEVDATPKPSGLNLTLPEAYFKDEGELDKMSYYAMADEDSAKLKQHMEDDPYYQASLLTFVPKSSESSDLPTSSLKTDIPGTPKRLQDTHETEVNQKLEKLNAILNESPVAPAEKVKGADTTSAGNQPVISEDIDRLEKMMTLMNESPENDPEMEQLHALLDKILDIQHPERVKQRQQDLIYEEEKELAKVSTNAITSYESVPGNDFLEVMAKDSNNNNIIFEEAIGFYTLEEEETLLSSNAIEARVYQTQRVTSGSTIKLQLDKDIYVNNHLIPKNHFVYGIATLSGDRLVVNIKNIRYHNSLFPVKLSVYDLDGEEGIFIPGAISREVAKESIDQGIQTFGIDSYDGSLGSKAAGAGIDAVKNLVSKKVKQVEVTVNAGYQVLLQQANINQQSTLNF